MPKPDMKDELSSLKSQLTDEKPEPKEDDDAELERLLTKLLLRRLAQKHAERPEPSSPMAKMSVPMPPARPKQDPRLVKKK
jgi:hypothetical protein